MNATIDGGFAVIPRREPLPAVALPSPPTAAPQTGPAAVPAAQPAEAGARLAAKGERDRQGVARNLPAVGGERMARPTPSSHVGPYERKLTYENEQARTYVDIVDPETNKLLMRIPPERLSAYLQQRAAAAADAGSAVNTRV